MVWGYSGNAGRKGKGRQEERIDRCKGLTLTGGRGWQDDRGDDSGNDRKKGKGVTLAMTGRRGRD